jgi:hypothetical protein
MTPLAAITLILAAGGPRATLQGTKPIPAAVVNPDAPFGFLYRPAYSIDKQPRLPASGYAPQPGDVLLMSDPGPVFTFLYLLAAARKPGHCDLVVALPDGRLGAFEAGFNDTTWSRISPLEWRLNEYPGTLWVRRRTCPLTAEQSARLTEFATAAADQRFNLRGFALQITPLRARGPLRTFVVGKPVGEGHHYFCAPGIVEALIHAGLVNGRTARPAATYPEDLFYDSSRNLYLNRHPPLANGGWEVPALWTRCPAGVCCGPFAVSPYTAFPRAGVYNPPAGLVSPNPATPNHR